MFLVVRFRHPSLQFIIVKYFLRYCLDFVFFYTFLRLDWLKVNREIRMDKQHFLSAELLSSPVLRFAPCTGVPIGSPRIFPKWGCRSSCMATGWPPTGISIRSVFSSIFLYSVYPDFLPGIYLQCAQLHLGMFPRVQHRLLRIGRGCSLRNGGVWPESCRLLLHPCWGGLGNCADPPRFS